MRNKNTLEYELKKLIRNLKPTDLTSSRPVHKNHIKAPKKKAEKVPHPVKKLEPVSRRHNTPEADTLKDEVQKMLKHRASLHSTLEFIKDDKDRGEAAHTILDLSDKIEIAYERLAHYDKHGVVPPVKKHPEKLKLEAMDKAQLLQRRTTLRTYLVRYERLVKKSKKLESLANNQERLDRYKFELAEVERLMNK